MRPSCAGCRRSTRRLRGCRARRTTPPKTGAHLVTALARLNVQNLARRSSLEAGSTREKKGGEEQRNLRNSVGSFSRETENSGGALACIPNGSVKWFYHSNLSSCGRRAKRAGCERARSRNKFFRHVPIAVLQGRQRRDAVAAEETQLGRCTARRLYPSRRCTFDEFVSLADIYAAGAPPPTHI
jgi:hypothetical protein